MISAPQSAPTMATPRQTFTMLAVANSQCKFSHFNLLVFTENENARSANIGNGPRLSLYSRTMDRRVQKTSHSTIGALTYNAICSSHPVRRIRMTTKPTDRKNAAANKGFEMLLPKEVGKYRPMNSMTANRARFDTGRKF